MKLVITEKPSVAKTISAVLKAKELKDGFFIGNGYIISWCIGHLLSLARAESYDEKYAKWRYADLPIIPKDYKYTVSSDKEKQIKVLVELMKRDDVENVINACDSGREGELIFRLVYEHGKCKKPIKRLWISSMEELAITDGFNNLHDGSNYDNLHQSALCRTRADWIVGINATRLFSVLYGETLNVGRVQSPTLSLIVNREQEIAKFIKEPFYVPEIDCKTFKATGEKIKNKQEAENVMCACNDKSAFVKSISKSGKYTSPPKLFDLTTLQREANRIFGYTAQQTLDYVQSLYEKKLSTYPRTDSRYLTTDMENSLNYLINKVAITIPFLNKINLNINSSQVVDNSKVTDHHAIIPTMSISSSNISSLPSGELNILNMICTRLATALDNKYEYEESIAVIECNGYIFKTKGKIIINEGFRLIDKMFKSHYKCEDKDSVENENIELPQIFEGEKFDNITAVIKEKFTTPPKSYTEDTLLKAMELAGTEELVEDIERKGLGTPATRAGIIEKLVKTEFINRQGKKLLPTEKGINLISILPDTLKSSSLTAEWENKLKNIEQGKLGQSEFMNDICDFTSQLIRENSTPKEEYKSLFTSNSNNHLESVGICPRCKNKILESKKIFVCENKSCEFILWKDSIFFKSKKVELTKSIVSTLLAEGRIFMPKLYSQKTGKTYSANIVLDDTGGKYVNFKMEF